ncbi:MAG TPA: FAD binding domain-containing protein, partial [Candidatus Limnocylindria bacterium]|nr:FAD binding domain-containing protein [Candidatus Limnocylindria bacterium]
MRPCSYERAADLAAAMAAGRESPSAALLAGGTTLLDLMKLNVMTPRRLVDITGLAMSDPSL